MKVLKFGGTSLKNKRIIDNVLKIIHKEKECKVVVVSAFGDTTEKLKETAITSLNRDKSYIQKLKKIEQYHYSIIDLYFNNTSKISIIQECEKLFNNLNYILRGIYLLKELSKRSLDYVLSFGELLSSRILSEIVNHSSFVNSTEIIITDNNHGNARVSKAISYPLIQEKVKSVEGILVMGGFFGKTTEGNISTMGLGASDYSAAIVGAAIDATEIQIWTDVNGFLSADPTIVDNAYSIKKISYHEALELSHFGARVLYPPSVQPAIEKNIPIVIKNTYSPDNQGTRISSFDELEISSKVIKGISSIDNVVLLNLYGTNIIGRMGSSARLFRALADNNVNAILISQAFSEFSITLAINEKDLITAKNAVNQEFDHEIKLNQVKLNIGHNFSVVAIVGENMRKRHGISGKLFFTLGRNAINVFAIAQGASESNISFIVDQKDRSKTLNAIHDSFFLSEFTELNIFLIGVGNIGKELVSQIKHQHATLIKENQLKLNIVGLANSKHYIINKKGVEIDELFSGKAQKLNLIKAIDDFNKINLSNSLLVDCTASEEVAKTYELILKEGVSVITANKIAASSSQYHYNNLKNIAIKTGVKFLYETNVGAGLPIISTIRDMVNSGDKILKLEAVLSGTLNYIFNKLDENHTLSDTIIEAKNLGISEPDPRIDLSGIDVIRKLLILVREAGYELEEKQIQVSPFLPSSVMNQQTLPDFLKSIKAYDNKFEKDRKKLLLQKKKWRYVAKFENGIAQVGLETVCSSHPLYELEGSNNIIILTTNRYKDHPFIIKGYGAGKEVTAAGVFADIMRVANA